MRKLTPEEELTAIADKIDKLGQDRTALFARRMTIWLEQRELGVDVAVLAAASRVQPVTFRLLVKRRPDVETE